MFLFRYFVSEQDNLTCNRTGECVQSRSCGLDTFQKSEKDCLNHLSMSDVDCQWYHFDRKGQTCGIFKDCPKVDSANYDFVNGERGCNGNKQ